MSIADRWNNPPTQTPTTPRPSAAKVERRSDPDGRWDDLHRFYRILLRHLNHREGRVYGVLFDEWAQGEIAISIEQIAERANLTERNVRRALTGRDDRAGLLAAGVVKRTVLGRKNQGASRYELPRIPMNFNPNVLISGGPPGPADANLRRSPRTGTSRSPRTGT